MASAILDASAVMAVVNAEPGFETVVPALPTAIISTVNYAEVFGKLAQKGLPGAVIRDRLAPLQLETVDLNRGQAEQIGILAAKTHGKSISLADRACLALAQHEGLPVLTADRKWAELDLGIDLVLIR